MQETHYEDGKVDVRVGPLAELLNTAKIDLLKQSVEKVTITPLNKEQIGDKLAAVIRDMRSKGD